MWLLLRRLAQLPSHLTFWFCLLGCALFLFLVKGSRVLRFLFIDSDPDFRRPIYEEDVPLAAINLSEILLVPRLSEPFAKKYTPRDLVQMYEQAGPVPDASLSLVLPVSEASIDGLPFILGAILHQTRPTMKDILVICPDHLSLRCRSTVSQLSDQTPSRISYQHPRPDISLHQVSRDRELATHSDHLLSNLFDTLTSPWVLVLDEDGIDLDDRTLDLLLNPKALPFPVGPVGFGAAGQHLDVKFPSTSDASTSIALASYLTPPFVAPVDLLTTLPDAVLWAILRGKASAKIQSCAELGVLASQQLLDAGKYGIGGFMIQAEDSSVVSTEDTALPPDAKAGLEVLATEDGPSLSPGGIKFLLVFDAINDIIAFSATACLLQARKHAVNVLHTGEPLSPQTLIARLPCALPVFNLEDSTHYSVKDDTFDVIISSVPNFSRQNLSSSITYTYISLPSEDLPFCDWIASLSLTELQAWYKPLIDISVITHDRPDSLQRLLRSLSQGRFFGSQVNLRIDMEQSADLATKMAVNQFEWPHGSVTVTRRVVAGGLLPAIVESWYPHSNHSYGIILEDDIELSPLFYAWAKMAVLKYRYGDVSDSNRRLFGASLYQQKHNELHPEGRKSFDASSLLAERNYSSNTPYLSPIACSWGAIYFPEHWREFHDYLAVRLSEVKLQITSPIVSDLRSNMWTSSWKKYFIEFAYLRAYVMLYPNYRDFVSFSTNHLEVGSHVSEHSRSQKNRDLFLLPLMPLPSTSPGAPANSTGLLELPDGRLAELSDLPTFNLTGSLVSPVELTELAEKRRGEMGCTSISAPFDVKSLFCLD